MGKIDDVFINLDHHGFKEAVVKRITMVDLLDNEMSSLLDARLKDEIKNLQQENKQLKERIQNILEGKEIPAICAKKYEEYEEQLVRKDRFIKMLQEDNRGLRKGLNRDALNYAIERANTIRKQVCDEIREKIRTRIEAYPIICEDENKIVRRCIFIDTIKDILNKIGQGEQE